MLLKICCQVVNLDYSQMPAVALQRYLRDVVVNKPTSLLVPLGGMPPSLCGRQVAQTPQKWQLSSECRHPIHKTEIQFTFS